MSIVANQSASVIHTAQYLNTCNINNLLSERVMSVETLATSETYADSCAVLCAANITDRATDSSLPDTCIKKLNFNKTAPNIICISVEHHIKQSQDGASKRVVCTKEKVVTARVFVKSILTSIFSINQVITKPNAVYC